MESKNTYSHLDEEKRTILRDMLYQHYSSREIAKNLGVSHTTVQREVKRNRIVKVPRIRVAKPSLYCKHFSLCSIKTTSCKKCVSEFTLCKKCKKVKCFERCEIFEPIECDIVQRWPYICPGNCTKHNSCKYPKYSYSPSKAEKQYKNKLIDSRSKPVLSQKELGRLEASLLVYINRGISPYAALEYMKDEFDIDVRTVYRYMENGYINIPAIKLPRKVRRRQRKNKRTQTTRDKIDRSGRTYSDFMNIKKAIRDQFWQMDSVEGKRINNNRILTIHQPLIKFQIMQLVTSSSPFLVVNLLDEYERLLGSRKKFKSIFPGFLVDRGCEFDLFKEMERSSFEPLKKRCQVYFCDANRPDQKGSAEKNHEHIRYILPKRISNFDKLKNYIVAGICSNINSYPRKSLGGYAPIDLAYEIIPKSFLDTIGIKKIPPIKVSMKALQT